MTAAEFFAEVRADPELLADACALFGRPNVYSPRTLADEVGLTPRAIIAAIHRGELAAAKRGRGWVISAEAVRAWATPTRTGTPSRPRGSRSRSTMRELGVAIQFHHHKEETMSLHRTSSGWAVRWRANGRNRSWAFDTKSDARTFETEIRRAKRLGTLAATLDQANDTLDTYVTDTWAPTYAPLLAPKTREVYSWAYDRHIAPSLGDHALHALTPPTIARWQARIASDGVGHPTIVKARGVLSAVLQTATENGLIPMNPVRSVRAPKAPLRDEVRPLAPMSVEALRSVLGPRDAVLVSFARLRRSAARGGPPVALGARR